MQTKDDFSYGVVPYIQEDGVHKFLLINQYSKIRGDTYWIFPKGHSEEEETGKETALRELQEETGLVLISPLSEAVFTIAYDFMHEGVKINKRVTYFLGEAVSKDFVLQEDEVSGAAWCTYEEAREKITYENSKVLLDQAIEYLNK